MTFFDLNIPYVQKPTEKQNRTKLVIKCMELGYTGIAYNRTIQGVMSDRDRCSIETLSPTSITSFLSLSPSFSAAVKFRRQLLGTSESSPFRQYTRLTVVVESHAQGLAINSGNPVLKTYDIVAVRPMNQAAFDQACEKLEVDIIAIDFAEKLPFRLKLPAVKAALKRGVYFEIVYSTLLGDAQVRRHVISNAKLLVSWTRGKNLIFSSGATCAAGLRGPFDAANLLHLFGLSAQLAKATVSKNCRDMMCKALRKRNFFKEAIKVEQVSSDKQLSTDEPFSTDWLNWDPLSSGDNDLLQKDMFESISTVSSSSQKSKTVDITSIIDTIQVEDQFVNLTAPAKISTAGNDLLFPVNSVDSDTKSSEKMEIESGEEILCAPSGSLIDPTAENGSFIAVDSFDVHDPNIYCSENHEMDTSKLDDKIEEKKVIIGEPRDLLDENQLSKDANKILEPNNQTLCGVETNCSTVHFESSKDTDNGENIDLPLFHSSDTNGSVEQANCSDNEPIRALVFSSSPGTRLKHLVQQRSFFLPLKRLLSPVSFRKVRRFKRTVKALN